MASECACVYTGAEDGSTADVYSKAIVAARKEHRCVECNVPIRRGEKHERAKGRWEGHWAQYRTCLVCVEIRDTLCCDGYFYGWVWDAIGDALRDGQRIQPCINELRTVAAREKLAAFYRESVLGMDA